MRRTRRSGFGGAEPLQPTELRTWARMHGVRLTPSGWAVVEQLDELELRWLYEKSEAGKKEKEAAAPPPSRTEVAKKLGDAFRSGVFGKVTKITPDQLAELQRKFKGRRVPVRARRRE